MADKFPVKNWLQAGPSVDFARNPEWRNILGPAYNE